VSLLGDFGDTLSANNFHLKLNDLQNNQGTIVSVPGPSSQPLLGPELNTLGRQYHFGLQPRTTQLPPEHTSTPGSHDLSSVDSAAHPNTAIRPAPRRRAPESAPRVPPSEYFRRYPPPRSTHSTLLEDRLNRPLVDNAVTRYSPLLSYVLSVTNIMHIAEDLLISTLTQFFTSSQIITRRAAVPVMMQGIQIRPLKSPSLRFNQTLLKTKRGSINCHRKSRLPQTFSSVLADKVRIYAIKKLDYHLLTVIQIPLVETSTT
jgi:hypothetical protein